MLEEAEKARVRKFVYCSTCGVHGDVEHPPANEKTRIAPADYYQNSKYEAEPVVAEFQARGMETVILRPAAIYGPGDPERFGMIFRQVKRGYFPCSVMAKRFTTHSTSTISRRPSSTCCLRA